MTAYCPTIDQAWPFDVQMGLGSSETAEQLRRNEQQSLEHYLRPTRERLILWIADVFASSQSEETPVDLETANTAVKFAQLLPRMAPVPEISSDPDGEMSFDWAVPSGKMFSVSVDKAGRLSYAGWFGENSRIHGTEILANTVPEEILRGIRKIAR